LGEAIVIRNLTKRYGSLTAVDGLNLEVPAGAVFGLLGPNGAGKTTTLEMIEGLRRADAGEVFLGDVDLLKHPDVAKQRLGVQLQATAFFELLTVRETLDLFRTFYDHPLSAASLIGRLNLDEKADAQVKALSGGQRQRLALAVALVNDPQVVFLDEPSAGLDPQARRNMWDLVAGLRDEGRTVVLTTHYMEEAEALCDKLAIIDHGKVLATGSPRDLVAEHLPGSVIEVASSVPLTTSEQAAQVKATGVSRVGDHLEITTPSLEETLVALVGWAKAEGVTLSGLSTRGATLEDLFLHLTGRSLREA
jgi:ABC-2 type transport system ATP-binding protein